MALIATPGAVDANSYSTLAEADTYHEGHLYASPWNLAIDATQTMALIMATRLLDAGPQAWSGSATDEIQALGWPRIGMLTRNGFAISEVMIPKALKDATAEFARRLIEADRTADNSIINQGISSIRAGSISLSFAQKTDDEIFQRSIRDINALAAVWPDSVKMLLVPSWLLPYEDALPVDENAISGLIFEVL